MLPFFVSIFFMDSYKGDLVRHLSGCITENRLNVITENLSKRTRYITVVLEDIYQSQNASAVLRSCDCFGIQDIHIIENRNEYQVNPDVALGSNQWLDLHVYSKEPFNTLTAIESLKQQGYRIVATSPGQNQVSLKDFNLEAGKSALLFGTEGTGLTEEAMSLADEFVTIPMFGFTESFNISVATAIILYELRGRLDCSQVEWQLSDEERTELLLKWLRKSIKKSGLIEEDFKKRYYS